MEHLVPRCPPVRRCLSILRYIPLFPIFNNYIMRNFLFSSLFPYPSLHGKYFLLFFFVMNTFNILFLSSCFNYTAHPEINGLWNNSMEKWFSSDSGCTALFLSFFFFCFSISFSLSLSLSQCASLYHISDVYILIIVVLMNTYICVHRERKGFRF